MNDTTFGTAGASVRRMGSRLLLGGLAVLAVLGSAWWLITSGIVKLPPGLYLGLLVGLVVAARATLERLEHRTGQIARGAEAEEAVARALSQLGPDYFVLHDVVIGLGNIDHAVVGQGGVYTIETKSHGGKVTLSGGELRLNGHAPDKNFTSQAYAEAMAVKTHLAHQIGGADYFVQPLLVFTNAFVDVHTPVGGVRILPLKWLLEALATDRERLSRDERHQIVSALQTVTTMPIRSGITTHRRGGQLARRLAARLVPAGLVLLIGWWLLLGGGLSLAVNWALSGFANGASGAAAAASTAAQGAPVPRLDIAKQHLRDYAPEHYALVSDLESPGVTAAEGGAADYTWHYVEQTGAAQAAVRSVTIRVNADGAWGGLSFGE